jgi:hypothetical protein
MCGGGGIPIVSDVVDFVGDTLDKADNWTEDVGEELAKIDPGPVIGDTLAKFDEEVLQQIDVGTVATVAAIATQQYYLVPYISAANTAIKGGDITDIATSFGISYAATTFAPQLSKEVLGATGSKVLASTVTGATIGAGTGGAQSVAAGKDFFQGAGRGAVVGGVTGAVSSGISEGYNTIKSELGVGTSYSPNATIDANFIADSASGLRAQGIGEQQLADILAQEGVDPFVATDAARMAWSDIGQQAIAQNLQGSYSANEMFTPPAPVDTGLEKAGKKCASDVISKSILGEILPSDGSMPDGLLTLRMRSRYSPTDDMTEDLTGFGNVKLTEVAPAKYDLKRFVNESGQSTMISFKDDQPQAPIPAGYKEAETIGAAEGGLMTTTMVKYSKKPLLAPRKKVQKPNNKTAKKGLAVKK